MLCSVIVIKCAWRPIEETWDLWLVLLCLLTRSFLKRPLEEPPGALISKQTSGTTVCPRGILSPLELQGLNMCQSLTLRAVSSGQFTSKKVSPATSCLRGNGVAGWGTEGGARKAGVAAEP